jgi:hypothetical protein
VHRVVYEDKTFFVKIFTKLCWYFFDDLSAYKHRKKKMEFAQVIIVGGGVIGLATTKTLGSKVNYVLVEEQNCLDGRILTVDPDNA